MAKPPDIKVTFKGFPPTEYDAAIDTERSGGVAVDLIACRPFDKSLAPYQKGNLLAVDDIKGIENFSDVRKSAVYPLIDTIRLSLYAGDATEPGGRRLDAGDRADPGSLYLVLAASGARAHSRRRQMTHPQIEVRIHG